MAAKDKIHLPVTFEAPALKVVPIPRRLRLPLATLDNIRLEMQRTYRRMRAGDLDTAEGAKLIFALTSLAKVTEQATVEKRVAELERLLEEQGR